MAVEGPGLDIGYLISNFDARNSAITGTTLGGPSGSGQFLAVKMSTVDFTFGLATSSLAEVIGILQSKPAVGEAGDIRFVGVSKAVSGSTAIVAGTDVMSDVDGQLVPYSSAAGTPRCGKALNGASAVGTVFSLLVYGVGPGSLA